jgi:hypothetical protein
MSKFFKLTLIGFIVFLSLSLSFFFSNYLFPGVRGKPAKWKAVILDLAGTNLIGLDSGRYNGEGWEFANEEGDVTIYATIGTGGGYRSIFRFMTYHPVKVQFYKVTQDVLVYHPGNELVSCGFPIDSSPLTRCLFDFLNDSHPWDEGYIRVQFGFFSPYSSDKNEIDYENMGIGDTMKMRMWFYVEAQNIGGDSSECNETIYHSIEGNAHGDINPNHPERIPYDIYLVRDAVDIWRIVVNTDFDNPNYSFPEDPYMFWYNSENGIREKYCVSVEKQFNKKKIIHLKEDRYPVSGRGHMEFQIKFIKLQKK